MKTTTLLTLGAGVALAATFAQTPTVSATTGATCAPKSAIAYTWNGKTGLGTITVNGTKDLCEPLYVTTAVYKMDKAGAFADIWPQTRVSYKPVVVKAPGTYQIGQTPICRQQVDIYASATTQPIPPEKLVNAGAQYGEPTHINNPVFWDNGGPWAVNGEACAEQPKPEQPKPEQPKPEQPKPEQPKPEQPKPEQPKPVTPAPVTPTPVPTTPQTLSTSTEVKPQVIAATGANPLQTVLNTLFAGAGVYSALYLRKRQ